MENIKNINRYFAHYDSVTSQLLGYYLLGTSVQTVNEIPNPKTEISESEHSRGTSLTPSANMVDPKINPNAKQLFYQDLTTLEQQKAIAKQSFESSCLEDSSSYINVQIQSTTYKVGFYYWQQKLNVARGEAKALTLTEIGDTSGLKHTVILSSDDLLSIKTQFNNLDQWCDGQSVRTNDILSAVDKEQIDSVVYKKYQRVGE